MSERTVSENNKLWETAEKIAQQVVAEKKAESEEERRKQKKRIVKLILLMTLIALIIVFASIAWFAQNKSVSADTMAIEVANNSFDIGTTDGTIRNETVIKSKTSYQDGETETISNSDYRTTADTDSLILRYTPKPDDPSTTDVDESVEPDIGPSSSGELSLYIIPRSNSAVNAKITLNIVSFAEIDKHDENGDVIYKKKANGDYETDSSGNKIKETQIIEIKNQNDFKQQALEDAGRTISDNEAAAYVKASDYLKGHIMFFGGIGDTDNNDETKRYYYTTPYTTREITPTVASGNKDKAVKVPIYWMWTKTLGQMALPNNDSQKRDGYPILADTNTAGKTLVNQYLTNNRASVFANNGDDTVSNLGIVTGTYDSQAFSDAFKNLSEGYNNADYEIGTRIAYFMIEVKVEQVGA